MCVVWGQHALESHTQGVIMPVVVVPVISDFALAAVMGPAAMGSLVLPVL